MAATTLVDIEHALKEYWSTKGGGGPLEMWSRSGALWRMLKKNPADMWSGDGIMKIPVDSDLPSNGGANFEVSYADASPAKGEQFAVQIGEYWVHMRLEGKTIALGTQNALVGNRDAVMYQATKVSSSFHRAMSYLVWSDGSGRIAKGDGAYSVVGDTITFLNRASTKQFEKGDKIVLIDQAAGLGANGMPTPRTGTLTVIAVGPNTIQLDANVNTIIGAVNTDYVSKNSFFGGGSPITNGVFTYVPITATEAATTRYGVPRASRVDRLSGSRVLIDGSMSAYQIIGRMGTALADATGVIDEDAEYCLFLPSEEIDTLMQEASKRSLHFQSVDTGRDPGKYCIGQSVWEAAIPLLRNKPIKIVGDTFLHDPNAATDDDRTYVLMNMSNFRFETTADGISWKDHTGRGEMLKKVDGKNEYDGAYGVYGGLACHSPAKNVIASTRANL